MVSSFDGTDISGARTTEDLITDPDTPEHVRLALIKSVGLRPLETDDVTGALRRAAAMLFAMRNVVISGEPMPAGLDVAALETALTLIEIANALRANAFTARKSLDV